MTIGVGARILYRRAERKLEGWVVELRGEHARCVFDDGRRAWVSTFDLTQLEPSASTPPPPASVFSQAPPASSVPPPANSSARPAAASLPPNVTANQQTASQQTAPRQDAPEAAAATPARAGWGPWVVSGVLAWLASLPFAGLNHTPISFELGQVAFGSAVVGGLLRLVSPLKSRVAIRYPLAVVLAFFVRFLANATEFARADPGPQGQLAVPAATQPQAFPGPR